MESGVKPKGRHPHNALSATAVTKRKTPGRYADGNGLYLVVDDSGARRWVLRTVVRRKRCDIGLGSAILVPLIEARELATTYRRIARNGGDPLEQRRRERQEIPTFAKAAEQVHGEYAVSWANEKHRAQWLTTLTEYAAPVIGNLRVDQISTPDVLRVLGPIWLTKPETARRVRQRIRTVLDWARAQGYRSGENPVSGVKDGLPAQPTRNGHHAALPFDDLPQFITDLRASDAGETVRLAFEFLILTAMRTGEVIGAKWDEIDGATWTIPAERMKAERPHRVPLSDRCLEILARTKELAGDSEFIFPGRADDKPISNMAFLMTLRRMGREITAHGFRSTFRDWAAEQTSFPHEVCEMALAHAIKDKTEAAYRRGDLFERRRELMKAWAAFATPGGGNVVQLRSTG
jgi:integrase